MKTLSVMSSSCCSAGTARMRLSLGASFCAGLQPRMVQQRAVVKGKLCPRSCSLAVSALEHPIVCNMVCFGIGWRLQLAQPVEDFRKPVDFRKPETCRDFSSYS